MANARQSQCYFRQSSKAHIKADAWPPRTSNGITVAKTPPAAPGAVPKQTYIGGSMTLKVGGRRAELTHVTNAHTDGDTWIYCMAGCCTRAATAKWPHHRAA